MKWIINTFSEYCTHMNDAEEQAMFKEMGAKTFYIGECIKGEKIAILIFQGIVFFILQFSIT